MRYACLRADCSQKTDSDSPDPEPQVEVDLLYSEVLAIDVLGVFVSERQMSYPVIARLGHDDSGSERPVYVDHSWSVFLAVRLKASLGRTLSFVPRSTAVARHPSG